MKTMIVTFKHPAFHENSVYKVYISYGHSEGLVQHELNRVGLILRESYVDERDYCPKLIREAIMLKGCLFNKVLVSEKP